MIQSTYYRSLDAVYIDVKTDPKTQPLGNFQAFSRDILRNIQEFCPLVLWGRKDCDTPYSYQYPLLNLNKELFQRIMNQAFLLNTYKQACVQIGGTMRRNMQSIEVLNYWNPSPETLLLEIPHIVEQLTLNSLRSRAALFVAIRKHLPDSFFLSRPTLPTATHRVARQQLIEYLQKDPETLEEACQMAIQQVKHLKQYFTLSEGLWYNLPPELGNLGNFRLAVQNCDNLYTLLQIPPEITPVTLLFQTLPQLQRLCAPQFFNTLKVVNCPALSNIEAPRAQVIFRGDLPPHIAVSARSLFLISCKNVQIVQRRSRTLSVCYCPLETLKLTGSSYIVFLSRCPELSKIHIENAWLSIIQYCPKLTVIQMPPNMGNLKRGLNVLLILSTLISLTLLIYEQCAPPLSNREKIHWSAAFITSGLLAMLWLLTYNQRIYCRIY